MKTYKEILEKEIIEEAVKDARLVLYDVSGKISDSLKQIKPLGGKNYAKEVGSFLEDIQKQVRKKSEELS